MPYIRSITFILFIGSLILPILGITYPSDYVASVIFFSLFVWLLALLNDFISALIALILSVFFTQRMLFLYIDPGMFKYQWVSTEQMTEGAFFCLTVIIGIYLASLTYDLIVKSVSNKSPKIKHSIKIKLSKRLG